MLVIFRIRLLNFKSNPSYNLPTFHSFVADSATMSLPMSTQYR